MKAGENGIDCRKDGATVATRNEHVGDGGDDADIGLGLNTLQSLLQSDADVVDDLGTLHARAGRDVQCRHVPANVAVTNDGENPANGHCKSQKRT